MHLSSGQHDWFDDLQEPLEQTFRGAEGRALHDPAIC